MFSHGGGGGGGGKQIDLSDYNCSQVKSSCSLYTAELKHFILLLFALLKIFLH